MPQSPSETDFVEPSTTLGPAREALAETVALPESALDAGCYVEGPQTPDQTALLHSWCVEWAENGHGFCYVHLRGPEPRDLMARLPEDRLEDVVWIDARRTSLAEHLDVPPLQRVAVDPFTVPADVDSALEIDPVTARRDAYMDAFSESPHHNRNVERILNMLLPGLLATDDLTVHDLSYPFSEAIKGSPDALLDLEPFTGNEVVEREIEAAIDRNPRDFVTARLALTYPRDPYPSNPLMDATTYDIATALENDHIVLVTGDMPRPERSGFDGRSLFTTQLLVGALICRLLEAAQTTDATRTFPLVLDTLEELAVGDVTLLENVLAQADGTPLAPVLSGPPSDEFEDPLRRYLADLVGTEVTLVDLDGQEIPSALKTGSLDGVEWYLEREETSEVAPEALCWLRTGMSGLLADAETLNRERQATICPPMPDSRHSKDVLAEAISQSVYRHGAQPQWMDEEMRAERRAKYEN